MSHIAMSQRPEDVRDNIVKIVDSKGNFHGTGFVIEIKQERYCITCHHCICRLKEIYIERDDVKCSTEWIEELSDMGKDIAVLKVIGCSNIKPLKYAKEALPQLPVSVWEYSDIELEAFPQGAPAKKGSLSEADFLFHWSEEKMGGHQKWNKKPKINVFVSNMMADFIQAIVEHLYAIQAIMI
jgi:hypothetical protein